MKCKAPTIIDKQIAVRLRTWRHRRKWSTEWVAKKLGITKQQLLKYETGINRVPASRLFQIAELLRVRVGTLYPPRHW